MLLSALWTCRGRFAEVLTERISRKLLPSPDSPASRRRAERAMREMLGACQALREQDLPPDSLMQQVSLVALENGADDVVD
eukprot:767968-Hanusia_phi.AAC.11